MAEYLDLRDITIELARQLAADGYGWLYVIIGEAQIHSIEVDLGNTKTHIGGFRLSASGHSGGYVLLNDGKAVMVERQVFCTAVRKSRTEVLGVCSQIVVSRSRFRGIHELRTLRDNRGLLAAKPKPGLDLVETFDPWTYITRPSIHLYATTASQVYEVHSSSRFHYACSEMFVQRTNTTPSFWLREPPTIMRSMTGYKVWSSCTDKDIRVPPFRHLFVSEEPLTAREIRTMFDLADRHGTGNPKPRNP